MSARIKRLEMKELRDDLRAALEPRVARLGYLGEFFRCAGHQPGALIAFQEFTEASKHGLEPRHVEMIALTVAKKVGNAYERNQHERLSIRLNFGREWVEAVEQLDPEHARLDPVDRAIQAYVLAALERNGQDTTSAFEALIDAVGPDASIAVMMVIGRYLVHGLIVNTLSLAPPVPSIFEDGFGS